MRLDTERLVADLAAKAEKARGRGDSLYAQALEECSRELQAATQAYDAALSAAHGLLDRSDSVTEAFGRRLDGPREDAVVHTGERVLPALARFASALSRCAALLREPR